MDNPICFSHYFINKQNIRTFKNVLNLKYLKEKDSKLFCEYILEDKCLADELPGTFINFIDEVRNNVRINCKEDFKQYFPRCMYSEIMKAVAKEDIFIGCMKALQDLVPKYFYGGNHNYKIFRKLVHTIIFSMNRQYLFFTKLLRKWDFSIFPWTTLRIDTSMKLLYRFLYWVMKYILSAIINLNFYVTTCKLDSDENKLYFFKKEHWQSFHDKTVYNMLHTKVIEKYELKLGSKCIKNSNLQERLCLKNLKKDIPKLHLILKPNNNCRIIVCYKNNQLSKDEKCKIKEKLFFINSLTGKTQEKMGKQYELLHATWLEKNKPKLYFIKTDLTNAFGSINKQQLLKIIHKRHLMLQESEKCIYMKRKLAQNFKDIMSELQKPLLIRIGSTIYEWKEGLVQGYKYSPALSELYYSYMDKIYFYEHHTNVKELKLFTRVVDDYLYITNSLEDAKSFLNALSRYKNVNYDKTLVNFPHEFIKFTNTMTFLGYSYNTDTLNVSRANNVYSGQMCYKISFSHAITNLYKFLENRIGVSGIQISGHIFNLHYNTEESLWEHIFITFCLAANKFCTILSIVCDEDEIDKYFFLYKKKVTVKLCNLIIEVIMKNKPNNVSFVHCINHLRYISYKALFLCAKLTSKCSKLVPIIKSELAKSNCMSGKWKEHASILYTNGKVCKFAIKEICRRPDLKIIMEKFENLPDGFQCYVSNKLLNDK
ncbi:PREDICTED: telomerase reverse transcriptase-like [Papilio xuthus]|uniref:Telomerase reverse transcriptase n=1 Tax=Papilio xuthus TaxID=66420 RepID=A0AAJ6Z565_PAPXU|nr:PREDICTED: telomerase reverse transcriptase-like [Papilio xuthus]